MATEVVDGAEIKTLVAKKGIKGATVLGQPGGWSVLVRYGGDERAIAARRARTPRLWRNLSTVAAFVRDELRVARFEVDARGHEPDGLRRRPDQSARMKARHEAAQHDAWFRAEVRRAVELADRPEAERVDHDRVVAALDARISRLKTRAP